MDNVLITKDGDIYRVACRGVVVEVYDVEYLSDTIEKVRKAAGLC